MGFCFLFFFLHVAFVTFQQLDERPGVGVTPEVSGKESREQSTACACGIKQTRKDRKDFGTHTGCSFQIFTSSAVRPASRMSRLTRDTLPALDYRQITLYITEEKVFNNLQLSAKIKRVELLAHVRVNRMLLDAKYILGSDDCN